MKNLLTRPLRFEFITEFSLLIDHIDPHLVKSPSGYIMNLLSLLDEAKRLHAINLLVLAPAEVYHLNLKMHDWVSRYLIPQMNHSGIKRLAFCVTCVPEKMEEHRTISGNSPEIGIFSSMPMAKAWILGISDRNEGIPTNQKMVRKSLIS